MRLFLVAMDVRFELCVMRCAETCQVGYILVLFHILSEPEIVENIIQKRFCHIKQVSLSFFDYKLSSTTSFTKSAD